MNETIKLEKQELENLLATIASQSLDAKIKELGLDKIDRKFGNFPGSVVGMSDEEIQKLDKKTKIAKFIKAVFHKDMGSLAALKALNESTGSAGGFIVPEEFAAEVNRIIEDFGLVRKFARRIPMGSDTMRVPRLATSVSVTYPGEGNAGVPSEFSLEEVALLVKTAVGLTVTSNELLADANVSVVDLLVELFGEALAGSEDEQGFTGSGSPFTGVLSDAGVNVSTLGAGKTTFTQATLDDYRDLIAQVKPWSLIGAGYIVHKSVWSDVQKKKDSNAAYHQAASNPVLLPGATEIFPAGVRPAGTLWGYPLWLSEKMPATPGAASQKFAIFGNLRHLWLGDRQQMTLAVSDAAVVGANSTFERNQSAVRITERISINVGLPKAFAVLRTAAV